MEKFTTEQLPELFAGVASMFAEKKEELCDMDAKMGDGDLGLTMDKGYGALPQLIKENTEPGRHWQDFDEGMHEDGKAWYLVPWEV